ncbi:MAG: hypothetical protein KDI01_06170, partial [Halioglobus sp.]|nr:hypothetical protein [Halioglobus sp.]
HPNHSQRLCRALEVYRASGVPLSEWHRQKKGSEPFPGGDHHALREEKGSDPFSPHDYDIVQLAICPAERAVLHRRIARRFEAMMAAGFLDEVRELRRRGDLHADLPALRAVGYRQLWRHLAGECSLEQAVERGIAASRQLAKRQLTWLRKWPDLAWIYTDSAGNSCARNRSQHALERSGQTPLQQALNYLDSPSL